MAQPVPGPPANPRLLAEPDRARLLGDPAEGADPQRLHRPRRGRSSPARLPAPLPADRRPVRLALHPRRPPSAPPAAGRTRAPWNRSMTPRTNFYDGPLSHGLKACFNRPVANSDTTMHRWDEGRFG